MIYNKSDHLDLGFAPGHVARLATMDPVKRQERKAWYMKLHPSLPYITISTDSTSKGIWAEDEVVNKYKKRN